MALPDALDAPARTEQVGELWDFDPADRQTGTVTSPSPQWPYGVPDNLQGGSPDAFGLMVTRIDLVGGSSITPPTAGVTAIVGGNNVGKSTLLRELVQTLSTQPNTVTPPRLVIQKVQAHRNGSAADLIAWLREHCDWVFRPGQPFPGFVRLGQQQPLTAQDMAYNWHPGGDERLGQLFPYVVHYSDAMQRAGIVQGVGQRPDVNDPPQHPLHQLQDDPGLLQTFSEISERIFRQPLTLDRISGNVQLRVGEPGIAAPPVDAVTREYKDAMGRLPQLAGQGDGMRSLLGLLLPVVTATYPLIVIDEPEAFLHPPQAFELGRQLARLAAERGVQVILATHDRNFLAGLLRANAPVAVVRVERATQNTAFQLDPDELRKLWDDPVMRYSNVLDGLFHRLVVIAEADQDCTFYAAALDAASEANELPCAPSEILFVPANGKDGMAKIAEALRAAHVTVAVSPDLDLLDDTGKVKRLVQSLGGNWASLEADYKQAIEPFRSQQVQATCGDVLAALTGVLRPHAAEPWTEDLRDQVRPHLRTSTSSWDVLKSFGKAAFKQAAGQAYGRLAPALRGIGLHLVEVGELEQFAPTLGVRKGREWLPAALAADAHRSGEAQTHVLRLVGADPATEPKPDASPTLKES